MSGATLCLVAVAPAASPHPGLWVTAGLTPGTGTLAAGMATSGLVANWVADTARLPVGELIAAAGQVTAGAGGPALLPEVPCQRRPGLGPCPPAAALRPTVPHTPAPPPPAP